MSGATALKKEQQPKEIEKDIKDMAKQISEVKIREIPRTNNRANVVIDYKAIENAKGAIYQNDFEFISDFVIEYNGKKISEYLRAKVRKIDKNNENDRIKYYTARFPSVDKTNILRKLNTLLNYRTERMTSKITQYHIVSVKMANVKKEKIKLGIEEDTNV